MKNFAGGLFNLDEKIVKIYNIAIKNNNKNEAMNAKRILVKNGYFLDFVGVLWELDKIPKIVKDNDKDFNNLIKDKLE